METDAELLFEEVDLFDTALIQGNCTNATFGLDDLEADQDDEE
jgi:hypothetical protein